MHLAKTGSVAYDDTYRFFAHPWMQALLIVVSDSKILLFSFDQGHIHLYSFTHGLVITFWVRG